MGPDMLCVLLALLYGVAVEVCCGDGGKTRARGAEVEKGIERSRGGRDVYRGAKEWR
jgi:hypothetical protein